MRANLSFLTVVVILVSFSSGCNRSDSSSPGNPADENPTEISADSWEEAAGDDVIPTYVSANCNQLFGVFELITPISSLPIENFFSACEGSMNEGLQVCPCRSGGRVSTTVSGASWEKTLENCKEDDEHYAYFTSRDRDRGLKDVPPPPPEPEKIFNGTIKRICHDEHCLYDKYIYNLEKAGTCNSLKGTIVKKKDRINDSTVPLSCEGGVTAICNGIEETCAAVLNNRNICVVQ